MSEWISVKDELPDQFVSVLGAIKDAAPFPSVREGYRVVGGDAAEFFYFPALGSAERVTHWMPLPEPPKEGEE